jgi:hypothetical protein
VAHQFVPSVMGNLNVVELEMTDEVFDTWRAKSLRFPTVRDHEARDAYVKQDGTLDFMATRAEFIALTPEESEGLAVEDWFPSRVAKLESFEDLGILEDIREFGTLIQHGLTETIDALDSKFEPAKAVDNLRLGAVNLRQLAEESRLSDPFEARAYANQADDMLAEADSFEKALAEGEIVKPRKESITISLSVMDFFPLV